MSPGLWVVSVDAAIWGLPEWTDYFAALDLSPVIDNMKEKV